MTAIWILPLSFIFLACCLSWLIIGCRGYWLLKLVMVFLSVVLGINQWVAFGDIMGYPKSCTMQDLNGKSAMLYAMQVDEPKSIYFWMRMDGEQEICSYKLPYSRQLHKQKSELSNGPSHVKFGGAKGAKKSATTESNSGVEAPEVFYILPPPQLPPKTQ